jgi:hypothetical protein
MRKLIGYILSWTFYWLGDLVSKPMHYLNWWWLYPVYNRLMIWSYDVQEWAGNLGPWRDSNGRRI